MLLSRFFLNVELGLDYTVDQIVSRVFRSAPGCILFLDTFSELTPTRHSLQLWLTWRGQDLFLNEYLLYIMLSWKGEKNQSHSRSSIWQCTNTHDTRCSFTNMYNSRHHTHRLTSCREHEQSKEEQFKAWKTFANRNTPGPAGQMSLECFFFFFF